MNSTMRPLPIIKGARDFGSETEGGWKKILKRGMVYKREYLS